MNKNKLAISRIVALLIVMAGISYFYLNLLSPRLIPSFLRIGMLRKPINILLIGTDVTYNAETNKAMPDNDGRADTIIMLHLNPLTSKINALSIPRDTFVNISGFGSHKINAAHAFGGTPLLKETVENLLGVKADYYIKVKPNAAARIVDLLGGIYVDVEADMRYVDHAQKLDINLKKGWQKLSGKQAHDFIRFRHDIYGDIGRVGRQQTFIKAATKQLARPTNILKSPYIFGAALKEIQTNLSATALFRILNWGRTLAISKIEAETLSGEATTISNAGSIWQVDWTMLKEQVAKLR